MSYLRLLFLKKCTNEHIFPIPIVVVVLHFPMNHQVMLHMQKVIEKMLPQRKEIISMNAGAHP